MSPLFLNVSFFMVPILARKPMRPSEKSSNIETHGGLAQLGERTLHRGDVAGSSPVASTFLMENAGIVPTSLS